MTDLAVPTPTATPTRSNHRALSIVAIIAALAIAGGLFWVNRPGPELHLLSVSWAANDPTQEAAWGEREFQRCRVNNAAAGTPTKFVVDGNSYTDVLQVNGIVAFTSGLPVCQYTFSAMVPQGNLYQIFVGNRMVDLAFFSSIKDWNLDAIS